MKPGSGGPAGGRRKASLVRAAAPASILALILAAGPACRRPPDRWAVAPDGVRIAYRIEGRGKPALVLIHGWCCSRDYWKNQIGTFAAKHAVLAVDLAGHGESGANRKEWSLAAFGADVAAAVKKEGLRGVVLIGHSMGGEVGLEAARILGDRVLGVIGIDTFQHLGATMTREEVVQAMWGYKSDFEGAVRGFVPAMFAWGADPDLVKEIAEDMASMDPAVGAAVTEALFSYAAAPTLRELKIPIRAVNSDRVPTDVEGNMKLAPSFRVEIMPGRGHFIQIEDPAGLNPRIEAIAAELAARAR